MKFEFDANQDYQRAAIDAVVQLFEGQIPVRTTLQLSGESNFTAISNRLDLDPDQINDRLKGIQEANGMYCLRFFRPLPKTRLCYNTISLKGVI